MNAQRFAKVQDQIDELLSGMNKAGDEDKSGTVGDTQQLSDVPITTRWEPPKEWTATVNCRVDIVPLLEDLNANHVRLLGAERVYCKGCGQVKYTRIVARICCLAQRDLFERLLADDDTFFDLSFDLPGKTDK